MACAAGEARRAIPPGVLGRRCGFLACLVFAAPAAAGAAEGARALIELGEARRGEGDLEAALEAFEEALGRGGGIEAALRVARCRLEMKDPVGAGKALERAGEPADPGARAQVEELRGVALVLSGREEEARPHLERARAGGRPQASHFLGLAAFHRGDHLAAVGFLEEAIRSDPEDYYSRLYLGWTLLELNRLEEARGALLAMRARTPTAEVEEMLGRVELRSERFEAAAERFKGALTADPGDAEAQFGLATALRRLGRPAEAREAMAVFRRLHQSVQAGLKRGYELNQRHLTSPGDAAAAEELGTHYLASGDPEGAERLAWRGLLLEPGRTSARILLARALARSGRYSAAALHYRKVLRAEPEHREARGELEELVRKHARRKDGPRG